MIFLVAGICVVLALITEHFKTITHKQYLGVIGTAVGFKILSMTVDLGIAHQVADIMTVTIVGAGLALSIAQYAMSRKTMTLRPVPGKSITVAPRLKHGWFKGEPETIHIGDGISASDAKAVMEACRRTANRRRHALLEVTINSDGGDADSGFAIADMLNHLAESHSVRIVVSGRCMSAAVSILVSVPATNRYALKGSRFMIHEARSGNSGKRTRISRDFDKRLVEWLSANTRIDPNDLRKVLETATDYFLDANEAHNLGLIGRII
jgi:ATP-dependent protease ClpP protease subunit